MRLPLQAHHHILIQRIRILRRQTLRFPSSGIHLPIPHIPINWPLTMSQLMDYRTETPDITFCARLWNLWAHPHVGAGAAGGGR